MRRTVAVLVLGALALPLGFGTGASLQCVGEFSEICNELLTSQRCEFLGEHAGGAPSTPAGNPPSGSEVTQACHDPRGAALDAAAEVQEIAEEIRQDIEEAAGSAASGVPPVPSLPPAPTSPSPPSAPDPGPSPPLPVPGGNPQGPGPAPPPEAPPPPASGLGWSSAARTTNGLDEILPRDGQGEADPEPDASPAEGPAVQAAQQLAYQAPRAAPGSAEIAVVLIAASGGLIWLYLLGFYNRLSPRRIESHPLRRALLDHIRSHPAATVPELARVLQVHPTTVAHHLRVLARYGHVVVHAERANHWYFENHGRYGPPARRAWAALHRGAHRAFLLAVQETGGARLADVAARLGLSVSTAGYRASILVQANLLTRSAGGWRLTPEALEALRLRDGPVPRLLPTAPRVAPAAAAPAA